MARAADQHPARALTPKLRNSPLCPVCRTSPLNPPEPGAPAPRKGQWEVWVLHPATLP